MNTPRDTALVVAGREMPHSLEMEARLLACCIMDGGKTLARCIESKLAPEVFYSAGHRLLYETLLSMHDEKSGIETALVCEALKERGKLDSIGGPAFVDSVASSIHTTIHAGAYLAEVLAHSDRRQTIRAAARLVDAIENRDDEAAEAAHLDLAALATAQNRAGWPEPVSAEAICNDPPATPEILIHGALYLGGTMLLVGPSKARKTFTLFDCAISIAAGKPWFGFETTRVPVLYVNLELPAHVAEQRLRAICMRQGIEPPDNLHLWNLRGHVVTIDDLARELPRRIAKENFGAVIIDPNYKVSATSGAEENSNDSIGLLLARLEAIHAKAGAALIIAHHFAKGDASQKNAIDRASGGGVFARWPDAFMALTPHEEEEAMTVDLILRSFAPVPSFVVRWDFPVWTTADDLDPTRLKRAGRSDAHPPEEALSHLQDGMSGAEWRRATGWPESTFRRKRDTLLAAGRIRQSCNLYFHATKEAAA